MKIVYRLGSWTIKKDGEIYKIYCGKNKIDSEDNFEEAYALLQQHKRSRKC